MATKIGDMAVYISANTAGLARDLGRAAGLVSSFGSRATRQMMSLGGSIKSSLGDVFKVAGGNLLASGIQQAAGSMKGLVADSIKLAAAAEATEGKFAALLGGSTKDAKRLMGDLRAFAAESPLSLTAATAGATRLLAAGTSRDQIAPTLRALNDISMGDSETTSRMIAVYGKVRGSGRLQGDELNQLTEAGALNIADLAASLKVGKEEVKSLVEAGRVGFSDLQKTIKQATEAAREEMRKIKTDKRHCT